MARGYGNDMDVPDAGGRTVSRLCYFVCGHAAWSVNVLHPGNVSEI